MRAAIVLYVIGPALAMAGIIKAAMVATMQFANRVGMFRSTVLQLDVDIGSIAEKSRLLMVSMSSAKRATFGPQPLPL